MSKWENSVWKSIRRGDNRASRGRCYAEQYSEWCKMGDTEMAEGATGFEIGALPSMN